jgi:hypothetical protein
MGKVKYNIFGFVFLVSSLNSLISMICKIVVTMHQKADRKGQEIAVQLLGNPSGVAKFVQLKYYLHFRHDGIGRHSRSRF